MKKNFFFAAVPAMMMAAAAFSFTSCEDLNTDQPEDPGKTEEPEKPVLTMEKTTVEASADADTYTIGYTVENEVEGAEISASAAEAWVKDFDCKTAGSISFSVLANEDTAPRSADVTVTYTYGEGETVEAFFSIEQAGAEEVLPPAEPPVVTIETEELSQFPASSADIFDLNFTVEVSVENEVEGGVLSASADVDWLRITGPDNDNVFSVSLNTNSGVGRTGKITVTYTYGDGLTATASLEVSQAAANLPTAITILGNEGGVINAPAEGLNGEMLSFSVDNGVEGGVFTVESDYEWIVVDNDLISQTTNKGAFMIYSVTANDTVEPRSGVMTIVYTFNDGQRIEKEVRIEQEAGKEPGTGGEDPSGADFNYTATGFSGGNYGACGDDGSTNYGIDLTGSDFKCHLDLYSKETTAPKGTFKFNSMYEYVDGNLMSFSNITVGDDYKELSDGTVVINDNNDGTFTIIVDLVDMDGIKYHIEYEGAVSYPGM